MVQDCDARESAMKVGDLVKRRRGTELALVVEMKESGDYVYPEIVWVDTGERDSCSGTLLEVVSESR